MASAAKCSRGPTLADDAGAAEKRLEYILNRRRKQKMYRDMDKEGVMYLRNRVEQLQAELRRLQELKRSKPAASSGTMLCWDDIASVLRDETSIALTKQMSLKTQRQIQQDVVDSLTAWLYASHAIEKTPSGTWGASNLSLKNVSLVAHPAARRHGFDWITQVMYHNTSHLFRKYAFPSTTSFERLGDFLVDFANVDGIQYVWRYQNYLPAPFEAACDAMRDVAVKHLAGRGHTKESLAAQQMQAQSLDQEILRAISPTMTYMYETFTATQKYCNLLFREFNDPDRCVFLIQTIPDDETVRGNVRNRKQMNWIVLDRIDDASTCVRLLPIASQAFTKHGGNLSFEDEAAMWGVDLTHVPEADHLDRFRRVVTSRCLPLVRVYDGYITKVAAALATPCKQEPSP
ncbi:Aste57867_10248 [Aphanomyces stellatus]|uniref:Aste57867_10248 protein n=1 Tax=Aphanomyces stellatus TaxID=120398 RepID=A0A485KPY3_9STRA|nr:hypothetical protein As57867_010209 [Aphanomyces stellatus]VFT87123.1 Aste57867_10248 [Aphanomyces stellatus]